MRAATAQMAAVMENEAGEEGADGEAGRGGDQAMAAPWASMPATMSGFGTPYADAVGCPIGTIRSRVARGGDAMAAALHAGRNAADGRTTSTPLPQLTAATQTRRQSTR